MIRDRPKSITLSEPLVPGWERYEDEGDGPPYFWDDETGECMWTPPTRNLDNCLAYLRDRVGVPRDMGAAAAAQRERVVSTLV